MQRRGERRKHNGAVDCEGKLQFQTWSRAQHAAQRSNRAKGREGERFAAYHCQTCHLFHVGSDVVPRKKKLRAI